MRFRPTGPASVFCAAAILCSPALASDPVGEGPQPSATTVSWEIELQFIDPRRIEVIPPGASEPEAFWYMVYTAVNTSDRTQRFFPTFQLVTEELRLLDTDVGVPALVFDAIAERHRLTHPRLVHPTRAIGELRSGNDYAIESVAIWRQGDVPVNNFTIFVAGLSGEVRFAGPPKRSAKPAAAASPGADAAAEGDKPAEASESTEAPSSPAADGGAAAAAGDSAAADANQPPRPRGARRGAFVLRKTLEIRYVVPGSVEARLAADAVRQSTRWVMR
ncbi:MAG: hypothetical protein IPM64_04895 [Phycisphaerales bacterium]|nr:hypothetical protein [Phycisphaerales bacterium]